MDMINYLYTEEMYIHVCAYTEYIHLYYLAWVCDIYNGYICIYIYMN